MKSLGPDIKSIYIKNSSEKEWREGREVVKHRATGRAMTYVKAAYLSEASNEVRIVVGNDSKDIEIALSLNFAMLQSMMAKLHENQRAVIERLAADRNAYRDALFALSHEEGAAVRRSILERNAHKVATNS
jgi:hypothetical protein